MDVVGHVDSSFPPLSIAVDPAFWSRFRPESRSNLTWWAEEIGDRHFSNLENQNMYKNIISLLCKARSNTATKKYRLSDGTVIIKIDQLL